MDVSKEQLMATDNVRLPTPPGSDEGTVYTDTRWTFTINNGKLVQVSDKMHRGDDADPIVSDKTGFLSFLTRIMSAVYPADKESRKAFTTVVYDDRTVFQVFSDTLQEVRRDHDAIHELLHCIILGYGATDEIQAHVSEIPEKMRESLVGKFMEKVNELFDFSDIDTFLSSFDLATERIARELRQMTGDGTFYVDIDQ
jgi:hypothetical protein